MYKKDIKKLINNTDELFNLKDDKYKDTEIKILEILLSKYNIHESKNIINNISFDKDDNIKKQSIPENIRKEIKTVNQDEIKIALSLLSARLTSI